MWFLFSDVRIGARNGFVNGTAEEDEHGTEDVYPEGPLQSGTQNLRRIKAKTKVSGCNCYDLMH